jgi:hypothetical protein
MNEEQTASADSSVEDRLLERFSDEQPEEHQEEGLELDGEQAEEQSEGDEPANSDALEVVEYEGKEYQVPAELKEALLRKSDYTRKTQETAERAAAIEAQERSLVVQQQFNQQIQGDLDAVRAIDAQIGQYQQLDWSQLDTDTYIRYKHQFDSLKEQRNELVNSVTQKSQYFQQNYELNDAKAIEAGQRYLAKVIPDFHNIKGELFSHLESLGFSRNLISSVRDPKYMEAAYKIMQYDKLMANKKNSVGKVKSAAPMIKPGTSQTNNRQDYKAQIQKAKGNKQAIESIIAKKLSRL